MQSRNVILAGLALAALAFTTGYTTGRSIEAGPALKSLHLLRGLPAGMSESDLAESLGKVNAAIAQEGHHMAGYRLWKVVGDLEGEFTYVWEGVWPSQDAYDAIHDSEAYRMAGEDFDYESFWPLQVYNRYEEIPTAFGVHCEHCAHMEHKGHGMKSGAPEGR